MDAARRDLFMNKLGLSILEVSLHKLEFQRTAVCCFPA